MTRLEVKTLDIRQFKKDGKIKQGDSQIELSYVVDNDTSPTAYIIDIAYIKKFKGKQPCFVCPICGKHVLKLYLKNRLFVCRHCIDLNYYKTNIL